MSALPLRLSTAFDQFRECLGKVRSEMDQKSGASPASLTDLRDAVRCFVDVFTSTPEAEAELEQRACYVAAQTGAGSDYEKKGRRFVNHVKGLSQIPKPLRVGEAVSELRRSARKRHVLAGTLTGTREHQEILLNQTRLTGKVRAALQEWHDEAWRIEREARLIEADGCWYLFHQAIFEATVKHGSYMCGPVVELVERAVAGLMKWRETEAADEEKWSRADYPSQFRKQTALSQASFYRKRKSGEIRTRKAGGKHIQVYLPDLEKFRN